LWVPERPSVIRQNGQAQGLPLQWGLGDIIGAFKSIATHEYIKGVNQHGWTSFPGKLWQRNYYEHIVRNEKELTRIREYK